MNPTVPSHTPTFMSDFRTTSATPRCRWKRRINLPAQYGGPLSEADRRQPTIATNPFLARRQPQTPNVYPRRGTRRCMKGGHVLRARLRRPAVQDHAFRIPRGPSVMTCVMEHDPIAVGDAITKYGFPPCLHVPVAARDLPSLLRFVGRVERELSRSGTQRALLVRTPGRKIPHCALDFPIWKVPAAVTYHANPQVWAHVNYRGYRRAYQLAYPNLDLSRFVIDHVENRRIARLKGWEYVRLCHIVKQRKYQQRTGR